MLFIQMVLCAFSVFVMALVIEDGEDPWIVFFSPSLAVIAFIILAIIWGIYKGHVRNVKKRYMIFHCTASIKIMFAQLLFYLIPFYCILAVQHTDSPSGPLLFITLFLLFVQIVVAIAGAFPWIDNYLRWRYKGASLRIAEQRIGPSVFISIPVFKSFGHFAIVIENWKYELRLSSPDRSAVFNTRPLDEQELRAFQETTFTYQWIPVGWTRLTHEERTKRFRKLIEEFGAYHFFNNNCRHFVSKAYRDVIVASDDTNSLWRVGHLPGNTPGTAMNILKTVLYPLEAHQEQFHDFLFKCIFGPDWDNKELPERELQERLGDALGLYGQTGLREWVVSAPGRMILSGDYTAAYGITTVAASLDLRCYGLTTLRDDAKLAVHFKDLDNFYCEWDINELPWDAVPASAVNNVYLEVVDQDLLDVISRGPLHNLGDEHRNGRDASMAFLYMYLILHRDAERPSFNFTTRSTLPIGAGLGSSTAFSVCAAATLILIRRFIGIPSSRSIPTVVSSQVYRWALVLEKVLRRASNPMDNKIAVCGGALAYTAAGFKRTYQCDYIPRLKSVQFILTNSKAPRDTRELVARIAKKMADEPEVANRILEAIQRASDEAVTAMRDQELPLSSLLSSLSMFMNKNHKYLASLGVSDPALESVRAKAAATPYELSSKLNGNGRLGCIVTLVPDTVSQESLKSLIQDLHQEDFESRLVRVGGTGLEVISFSDKDHLRPTLDPTFFSNILRHLMIVFSLLTYFPRLIWHLWMTAMKKASTWIGLSAPAQNYELLQQADPDMAFLIELRASLMDASPSELADWAAKLTGHADQMGRWHYHRVVNHYV